MLLATLLLSLPTIGCVQAAPESNEPLGRLEQAYKHPLPPGPPYAFYLTTFGAGSDAQNTSCGKWVDGSWWYSTGVYHWGCGSKLKVEANGKCGVVEVTDNGPADWVEAKAAGKCNGAGGVKDGYILDVSPLLAQHLFGVSSGGWSDCYAVLATPVPKSTPTGPCQSTGPVCGDGKVEGNETCDPPSSCPTSCDDSDPCTGDALIGSAAACTASCTHAQITLCIIGDGCCPPGCTFANDSDCAPPPDSGPPPTPDSGPPPSPDSGAPDSAARDSAGPKPDLALPRDSAGPKPDVPPTPPPPGGTPSGGLQGGCAIGPTAAGGPSLSAIALLALLGLAAARRRRQPGKHR
jgi:MYXO-CTERM domain-containing protein